MVKLRGTLGKLFPKRTRNSNFAADTHIGLVRKLNEDSYLASPELGLWVVADGMGGHEAGDVASGIAVRVIEQQIRNGDTLSAAIEAAHRAIQADAGEHFPARNMGATVVALRLDELDCEVAWVGDSRAYLWNGGLRQLTKDHSYIQMMLDAGLVGQNEIAAHPSRNIIIQGLGVGTSDSDDIRVDCVSATLKAGDSLLLCSDGLCGLVPDERIARRLAETDDNRSRVDALIADALEAGGNDNITVIVVSV